MYELLKDWGDHKKGSTIELLDETVIKVAVEQAVVKEVKGKAKTE